MKKHYLVGSKIFFSLLGLSAIVTEIAVLVAWNEMNVGNFFSYFTIEANIISATVFLVSALYVFANKKSATLDFFRGANAFFMVVVGIVFAVLLSGLEGVRLTAVPWDNIVLHYIIPIAAIADWIIDPPKRRIQFKKALLWLILPIAYLVYSLVRGGIVGWYPYPFLNPAVGGYERVGVISFAILVLGIVLAFLVSRWGARKALKK